jgi:prepilin-type N-terminal cleavage/methylation domain-containing protein
MNKHGVTLVELLAVIAIIGLLAAMITPGYIVLRNNVLQNSLENKISQIENAAKDYGYDHINEIPIPSNDKPAGGDYDRTQCDEEDGMIVMVKSLISGGYLSEKNSYNQKNDDLDYENQIINPVTGESMNFRLVCIRFDKQDPMARQLDAYLVDTGGE